MQPPSALPNSVPSTVLFDAFRSPLPNVAAVPAVLRTKALTGCEPSPVGTSP
jgi:hypothetical protein